MKYLTSILVFALALSLSGLSSAKPSYILAGGERDIESVAANANPQTVTEIKCGDTLRITHVATGAHLHSHPYNYGHPRTSGQQQVTAYQGTDYNDLWIVQSSCGAAVKNGDQIKLEHAVTKRRLHSHPNIPAPITQAQQEVTGWGGGTTTDKNDLWKVEVEGGGAWTTDKQVRLIHVATNAALHSHPNISHPQWTMGQQEVTAYAGRDQNDFWKAAITGAIPAQLGFSAFCCDKTTEPGADEVYIVVAGKSNTGREYFGRLPNSSGHWDMNDGDQGTKPASGYSGDAHCISDGALFSDIRDGETWNFAVLIMEEDGGTTRTYQQIGSEVLKQIDNPYTQATGYVLGVLTKLGFFATDTDDYIGSFGVQVANSGGQFSVNWRNGDRVSFSQADPNAPDQTTRHEFRFNGDGTNYVGWFYIR